MNLHFPLCLQGIYMFFHPFFVQFANLTVLFVLL